MTRLPMMIAATLGLLAAAPATATFTINATAVSQLGAQGMRPVFGGVNSGPVGTSRLNMQMNSTSYPNAFLGATAGIADFVAFCAEPGVVLTMGSAVQYEVVSLSQALRGTGGIGQGRANLIRELFGRFAPGAGFGAMDMVTSSALQIATWEIIKENPANPLSIDNRTGTGGDFAMFYPANTGNNRTSFNTAQAWLAQLNGTGPLARGLVVLRNGTPGLSVGSQDLLAFSTNVGVPEPTSWAMLMAGFGLVGATLRRRRIMAVSI